MKLKTCPSCSPSVHVCDKERPVYQTISLPRSHVVKIPHVTAFYPHAHTHTYRWWRHITVICDNSVLGIMWQLCTYMNAHTYAYIHMFHQCKIAMSGSPWHRPQLISEIYNIPHTHTLSLSRAPNHVVYKKSKSMLAFFQIVCSTLYDQEKKKQKNKKLHLYPIHLGTRN